MSRNGICSLTGRFAERMKMSLAVTALAKTRIRTSFGLGDGLGTWLIRRTSGGPNLSLTTAVMLGPGAIGITSARRWSWPSLREVPRWTTPTLAPVSTTKNAEALNRSEGWRLGVAGRD
jgi:hypothetical protein